MADGVVARRSTGSDVAARLSGGEIEAMVRGFEEERSARRMRRIRRVSLAGFICAVLATAMAVCVKVGMTGLGRLICDPLAYFCVSLGLFVCTSCPAHDMDDVLARSPKSRTCLWLGLGLYNFWNVVANRGELLALAWVPLTGLCLWACAAGFLRGGPARCRWCPSQLTMIVLFVFLSLATLLATPVSLFTRPNCTMEVVYYLSSMILTPWYASLMGYYALWRYRFSAGKIAAGHAECPLTLSAYYTLYAYFLLVGCHWLFSSLLIMAVPPACLQDDAAREDNLEGTLDGLAFILPTSLVLLFGRGRMFGILAWYLEWTFERTQAAQDGAFISTLFDSVAVQEGGDWWVHHGRRDEQYDSCDPRHNWERAKISRIDGTEMAVEIPGSADSPTGTQTFTMQSQQSLSSNELMRMAQREMRCIDWSVIEAYKDVLFLLNSGSVQKSSTSAMTSLSGGNLFGLSRPVREHEETDFFVSHSWHDDGAKKWEVLESFVHAFHAHHHRHPTFWFDNVCIDQSKLHEGLKMLPINLMKCRQMLVLTGRTYPFRLWCVWELLTLFAFSNEQQALGRVKVLPLDEGKDFDALACLESFHVKNAHCYDPNDEARLRTVIEAVGEERFNDRIRVLAKAIQERQMSAAGKRLSSFP